MTTERGSFDDPAGIDAITATREDELTGTGLDDAEPATGAGYATRDTTYPTSSSSGDRLQEAAGGVVDRVAGTAEEKVGTQVNSQLNRAGDVLEQVAGAVRQSGDQLRDQQPQIAGFADTAAQQVEKAAGYLRRTDMQGLLSEAESFARRQPAVFLGGALALGLIASRFLKASPQGGSGGGRGLGDYRGYGAGYGGGYGSSYGAGYRGGYGSRYGTAPTGYGESTYGSTGTGGYGGGTGYAGTTGTTGTTGAEHGGV